MDDLLVIILTLIFAGIGALGQIKKKKQNKNEQPAEEKQDNFWDFLNEQQAAHDETEEKFEEQQEVIPQPEKRFEPVKEQPRPKYEFKAGNEGTSIYGNDLTTEPENVVKKVKKKKIDFSLRKAVIYSEILNRKYQ